jgi:hypothetical protein
MVHECYLLENRKEPLFVAVAERKAHRSHTQSKERGAWRRDADRDVMGRKMNRL